MIRHLTAADFTVMPWANGGGQTTEMIRVNRSDGSLLYRISLAAVMEDGPFSVFPGVDRILTVTSGPGFDLRGDASLRADPLKPLAFSGDLALRAEGVQAPCDDINVMVRRGAMRAGVAVQDGGTAVGAMVALIALSPLRAGWLEAARYDLILTDAPITFDGQAIVVTLTEV